MVAAVLVSGPPASGKTTLATALASALGYAIVDLDTVTGALTRAALRLSVGDESALDSPLGAQLRAPRYEALVDVAAANLTLGLGVVLAAPFTAERSSPQRFAHLARRLCPRDPDRGVALLYVDVPDDVVRRRLESRNAARDREKLMRPSAAATPAPLIAQALAIDGTTSIADQVTAALGALGRPENRLPGEAATC